ncbi:MAG: hypothetical protein Q8N16_04005 [bacterium]|nr:hypothetical protein [bacterium]
MAFNSFKGKAGISAVEILIVVFIISIALTALIGVVSFSLAGSVLSRKTVQAEALARGAIEITRNFRDGTSWNINGLGAVLAGTPYHFRKTTDIPKQWQLAQGEESILGFSREVVFGDAFRDASDNIVDSGGTKDPETKKVTVIVSWQEKSRSHQISLFTYLTNWQSP